MATKFADYCVSAVRYNAGGVHIDQVQTRQHDVVKNQISGPTTMSRAEVVKLIGQGKTFATIVQNKDNNWVKGAPLQIHSVATDYIKTVADRKTSDNLENLPQF